MHASRACGRLSLFSAFLKDAKILEVYMKTSKAKLTDPKSRA